MPRNNDLEFILNIDPVARVEQMVKLGFIGPDEQDWVMLGYAMEANRIKRETLESLGDTHYSIKFAKAAEIVEAYGFHQVGSVPFIDPSQYEKKDQELRLYWHPELYALLVMETYGTSLNSGQVYFNWTPNDSDCGVLGGCSYSYRKDGVFPVHYDIRSALIYKLNQLRENGKFVKWSETPFLWLLNYMDTRQDDYDYKAINEARLATLPVEVREGMGLTS